MKRLILVALSACVVFECVNAYCEDGWVQYIDKKCYKVFRELTTWEQAQNVCEQENATIPKPSLANIHTNEELAFLQNLLFVEQKLEDHVWIGAHRQGDKVDDPNKSCVELMAEVPGVARAPRSRRNLRDEGTGKWINVLCEKHNAFVCERYQDKGLYELNVAFELFKEQTKKHFDKVEAKLQETVTRLDNTVKELAQTKAALDAADKNKVPINFVYVQLPNASEPKEIWPRNEWTEITADYAGTFFRAAGGGSAEFGTVQEPWSPYLNKVSVAQGGGQRADQEIPREGCSAAGVNAGVFAEGTDGHLFCNSGGEVRPRNYAVRLWKRTA